MMRRREAKAGCARGDDAGYTQIHGTLMDIPSLTCCNVLRMIYVAIKLI